MEGIHNKSVSIQKNKIDNDLDQIIIAQTILLNNTIENNNRYRMILRFKRLESGYLSTLTNSKIRLAIKIVLKSLKSKIICQININNRNT